MVKEYKPLIIGSSVAVLLICLFVIFAILRRVRRKQLPAMSVEEAKNFDVSTTINTKQEQ